MRHLPYLFFLLISLVNLNTTFAAEPQQNFFHQNDEWLVVGDSITHDGSYYSWIYLYYITRFPEMKFYAENCGISGDTASKAALRYEWDIQPKKGTVATIMLGMNDVNRDLYNDKPETPDVKKRKESALNSYRENITKLAEKLHNDGVRMVFMTPSIFDETVELDRPKQTGVNEALGECATFVRELAQKYNAPVLSLHDPMGELNKKLQAKDPKFTLIGPDRIHPRDPGHFVMAYLMLKSLVGTSIVSKVSLDVSEYKILETANATVSDFKSSGGVLTFNVFEKSLPYPISDAVAPALEWIPFQQDFNQEILSVKNLPSSKYTLFIDGVKIKDCTAEELFGGINLAVEKNTPQYKQALEVLCTILEWRNNEAHRRVISQVESWHLKALPHPVLAEVAIPDAQKELDRINALPKPLAHMDNYSKGVLERYLKYKPQEKELAKKAFELMDKTYETVAPKAHTYTLTPLP